MALLPECTHTIVRSNIVAPLPYGCGQRFVLPTWCASYFALFSAITWPCAGKRFVLPAWCVSCFALFSATTWPCAGKGTFVSLQQQCQLSQLGQKSTSLQRCGESILLLWVDQRTGLFGGGGYLLLAWYAARDLQAAQLSGESKKKNAGSIKPLPTINKGEEPLWYRVPWKEKKVFFFFRGFIFSSEQMSLTSETGMQRG